MNRVVLVAVAALLAMPAAAQMDSREGIALQDQILELRQEVQALQQQQAGGAPPAAVQPAPVAPPPEGGAPPSDVSAQLVVRVGALEEQVRQLQGRVDDLTNQLQRQNDDLSKQIGDLAFKLGQGPGGPGVDAQGGPPAAPAPAPVAPPPPVVKRTPELALKAGNAALARRDYPAAAAAAREVLAAPGGPRTTDAQYLLAQADAGQHDYKHAAADFYGAYNRAPKGGRAPDALLGVANSLISLNDPRDACQALAKLHAEFPAPPAGVKAGLASARKRAACP